jgi:hypothetical protein
MRGCGLTRGQAYAAPCSNFGDVYARPQMRLVYYDKPVSSVPVIIDGLRYNVPLSLENFAL